MSRFVLAAALALGLAGTTLAASPYDELLKHASGNTNTIVLIDVKGAFASQLAKNEKWAEKTQQSGYGGLGFMPPDGDHLAITSEINFTTMVRDFQIGLVKVRNLPNFKELATREGGTTAEIAGQLTVLSPRNVYFTNFPGSILAAVYPADRQYVARWLKANKAGKLPPLSPILRKAADGSGENTLTIALDLEDVVEPTVLRFGLRVSPVMVKNKNVNQFALSVFLSRMKGLTFSAKVTDTVKGTLVVEWPDDVNRYKGVLKDLFLELVDSFGIAIEGLNSWEVVFTDTTMTLSGSMSSSDLKRIVSLFSFPQPGLSSEAPVMNDEPTAGATQRYLVAVDSILADIRKVKENKNYEKTATWHDKAAAQLEHIGRKNVDPLAVDFAFESAKRLRAIANSLRGVPLDLDALAQKGYVYTERNALWGGWWGGWGGLAFAPTSAQTNVPEILGEMSKVIANDKKKRDDTWAQIDNMLADTKRKLESKYKMKF
ncbi:MAG: hypothetical protein L0241_12500 [Planctomycetia bacterium]|nr:hypothetical protein [Planctomycetia bacterium]